MCSYKTDFKGYFTEGDLKTDINIKLKYEGLMIIGNSFDKYGLATLIGFT
jgi:hypothetical protein